MNLNTWWISQLPTNKILVWLQNWLQKIRTAFDIWTTFDKLEKWIKILENDWFMVSEKWYDYIVWNKIIKSTYPFISVFVRYDINDWHKSYYKNWMDARKSQNPTTMQDLLSK